MNLPKPTRPPATIPTCALKQYLGFLLSAEFIKNELKVKPAFETKTAIYWLIDDIAIIKIRLARYLLEFAERNDI